MFFGLSLFMLIDVSPTFCIKSQKVWYKMFATESHRDTLQIISLVLNTAIVLSLINHNANQFTQQI